MANDEQIRQQVRQKLNVEKVKLWERPYTLEDGTKGSRPEELIARYSRELQISEDDIEKVLEELRQHALEKLAARKVTLKIRPAGIIPDGSSTAVFPMTVDVHMPASTLKADISNLLHVMPGCLKLVAHGRVLDDSEPLMLQGLKNDSMVMAICVSAGSEVLSSVTSANENVTRTRQAAELLSRHIGHERNTDSYQVSITDQAGKAIDMPLNIQKALTLAMTLHEKGRLSLKKRQFGEALLLLLEADKEFSKCDSSLLSSVDNYALVCLDIVWCYLCLQSINDLADAKRRLEQCEKCFTRSYGANLERVAAIKGNTSTERALYVRLHLLQGILAYHENKMAEARRLLAQADAELKQLHVNEDQMTEVMAMGFSSLDARLALRACSGDVQRAVQMIINKKEEEAEVKRKELADRHKQREARVLGRTADGQWVNAEHYEQLVSMGYSKGTAAEALRQANNDIIHALQIISESPELLTLPDPQPAGFMLTDDLISQVAAMGFDVEAVKAALCHHRGNVRRVTEELLSWGGGQLPAEWVQAYEKYLAQHSVNNTSGAHASAASSWNEEEEQLLDHVLPEIKSQHKDDYLDLSLDDEAHFLHEYQLLLS